MSRVDALVAEHPAQLEHSLKATDYQPFEMEFGGDPEIHVYVQGVVVGHERSRQRAPRQALQHGRFNFDEVPDFELSAQFGQNPGPHRRNSAGIVADNQIEVPLAVAALLVLKSVPLFGKRPQTLGE